MNIRRQEGYKSMRSEMLSLIQSRDLCVLATVSENLPHCSLMAYVTNAGGREIYMITQRSSKKFLNLTANPKVSLLIDDRESHGGPERSQIKALTVSGTCRPVQDREKQEAVRERMRERHPHMKDFIDHPEAEVLCIRVESLQLLDGLSDAYFQKLDE